MCQPFIQNWGGWRLNGAFRPRSGLAAASIAVLRLTCLARPWATCTATLNEAQHLLCKKTVCVGLRSCAQRVSPRLLIHPFIWCSFPTHAGARGLIGMHRVCIALYQEQVVAFVCRVAS